MVDLQMLSNIDRDKSYTPSDLQDSGLTSIRQSKNSPNQRTWLVLDTQLISEFLVKPAFVTRNHRSKTIMDQHSDFFRLGSMDTI